MSAAVPTRQGLIAVAPTSYLLYGFPPASTITITVSGPRGSESSPLVISPFGSNFDTIAATRALTASRHARPFAGPRPLAGALR